MKPLPDAEKERLAKDCSSEIPLTKLRAGIKLNELLTPSTVKALLEEVEELKAGMQNLIDASNRAHQFCREHPTTGNILREAIIEAENLLVKGEL